MEYSVFDIIGPVMIGPSSSHTAGATKIGYIARGIFGEDVTEVTFFLHGSFAKTYRGHGTDKALLAGIMGFLPDDERIKNAYKIIEKKGIHYTFTGKDLGEVHPNTVKIHMIGRTGREMIVMGSSIGGGKVVITKINDFDVDFNGEYTTLITKHVDRPGVMASITSILAQNKVNIAFMKLFRQAKGDYARLVLESDEDIDRHVLEDISKMDNVVDVTLIQKLIL
ncbi:L-serine ammonia-lyase, iron-sulfur-dependent, subunit beta [Vallitalea pronyensis]|uniref:L-serine deaminase n=1 Tax=Vallitalea pronyensis TaxID=1348613 RepID=A0A8J8MFX9_9FIRM|nr:L-serine ammonia-lyase, iron-sulfur-dependent subunit beta [Vallitalea pronyensis]QUI21062.1 L-serine ammonia-lyase, iron-sulfur-dependent, subunit beta [Vallitalea pronyensis]